MKKLIFIPSILLLVFAVAIYFLTPFLGLSKENIITISGFYFVLLGSLMVYFQLRINLNFNKRREAINFSFGPIVKDLQPMEYGLKNLLKKKFFVFGENEQLMDFLAQKDLKKSELKRIRSTVAQILNFYERMAVAIFKGALDEDICYDDKGFLMISFYRWTRTHILAVRGEIHDVRIWINFEAIARKWEKRYAKSAKKLSTQKTKIGKKALVENPQIY
jgi:hypothetical protein